MADIKQGVFMATVADGATEAKIEIVGVIGWDAGYLDLKAKMDTLPASVQTVTFDIYSPGGDIMDGSGIVQRIGELGKGRKTVARVQVAASMATAIALACDERHIAANGRWLVHNPWTVMAGDAAALEKQAASLRQWEQEFAEFYAKRTGKEADEMRALMDDERWLTPAETKDYGFVQEIDDPFDVAAYAGVRAELEAAGKWPKALVEPPKPEGKQDAGTNDNGAEATTDAGDAGTVAPADDTQRKADIEAAYARGVAEGEAAAHALLDDKIKSVTQQIAAAEAACRKMQGERDRAHADGKAAKAAADKTISELVEKLKEANARMARLLDGSLAFSPAVETWADAMRASGGDYEQARKRFPEVFEAEIAGKSRRNK